MPFIRDYLQAVRSFSPNARRFLTFTALNAVAWSAFNLTFNLYLHSLGYSPGFIGQMNGFPAIVILVAGLPIGMLADRYGYRRFLIAGSILTALAALGQGLSSVRPALYAFTLIGGLGASLSWVLGAPMMMAISTKEERVFLFAVQQAIMMGSGFLGSLLAGFLPEVAAGILHVPPASTTPLRLAFLVGASFNLAALLPILRMSQVHGNGATAKGPARRWPLPKSWQEVGLFARILGPAALVSFGAGAMVVFFQLFFRLRFSLNPGSIGILFAFSSIVAALATLASPFLAKRFGRVRTIVGTQLASIPFLLLLAYSFSFPAVVVAYYVRNALMNMSGPLQTIFGLELVRDEQRATLTSLSVMLGSLGRGGLGPIVSGYLQEKSGFTLAFTMTTVCYVVATLLFFLFFRNYERRPGSGTEGPAAGRPVTVG